FQPGRAARLHEQAVGAGAGGQQRAARAEIALEQQVQALVEHGHAVAARGHRDQVGAHALQAGDAPAHGAALLAFAGFVVVRGAAGGAWVVRMLRVLRVPWIPGTTGILRPGVAGIVRVVVARVVVVAVPLAVAAAGTQHLADAAANFTGRHAAVGPRGIVAYL